MPIETYLLYLTAVFVFFASPPDTSQLLIVSNSIAHSLRKSAATIAGDLTANALQMTAAAFGLAAIIASVPEVFVWIKWLGVAYLIWIGVQLIRKSEPSAGVDANRSAGLGHLFGQGFFTSLANPYAIVFFGAFFPLFIDPALPVWPQLLILGITYLVVDGSILVLWGWLGVRAARLIGHSSGRRVNIACGAMMIAASLLLAIKGVPTTV